MARHGFNTLWQQQSPASAVALLDFHMQKGSQCFVTLWTPLHHVQGEQASSCCSALVEEVPRELLPCSSHFSLPKQGASPVSETLTWPAIVKRGCPA